MDAAGGFQFRRPPALQDRELHVVLTRCAPGDFEIGRVPSYWFTLRVEGKDAGVVNLRIGVGHELEVYEGHFAYTVYPPFRGHHYAERACRLLLPLAREHGLKTLWITCHPENHASRRTCERLGAVFVELTVRETSESLEMIVEGDRERCRYRIDLGER